MFASHHELVPIYNAAELFVLPSSSEGFSLTLAEAMSCGLPAVVPDEGRERIVGVSRYSANESGSQCECAVTVSDDWQNKGLGTLLMRHLIEVARSRGIQRMMSIDSAENARMQDLANYLGFETRVDPDDASQVIHELEL